MSDEVKYLCGDIQGFTTEPFIKAAELLVQADEPERAIQLLSNLPAKYRDMPPVEIEQLRAAITGALITPHGYMASDLDSDVNGPEIGKACVEQIPRGRKALDLVKRLNDKTHIPHIVEMGPGEYWLPIGLFASKTNFTYHDIGTIQRTADLARTHLPENIFWRHTVKHADTPYIFVAYELIEHLAAPSDLAVEAVKYGGRLPDFILLSTPLYCFDGRVKEWRKPNGLPHLRGYTPNEFVQEAVRVFPGYSWEISYEQIMILKGEKNNHVF